MKHLFLWVIGIGFFLAAFFALFRHALIDVAYEEMQFALSQVNTARSAVDLGVLDMLVHDVYFSSLTRDRLSPEGLISLEGARSLLQEPKMAMEQRKGISLFLELFQKERQASRTKPKQVFEVAGSHFADFLHGVRSMIFAWRKPAPQLNVYRSLDENGITLFKQANGFEFLWQFDLAEEKYEEFLNHFSEYEYQNAGLVKARYGYLEAKRNHFQEARNSLKEVVQAFPGVSEGILAELLLDKLAWLERARAQRDQLALKLDQDVSKPMIPEDETADSGLLKRLRAHSLAAFKASGESFFKLGVLSLFLYDLDGAHHAFEQALNFRPAAELERQIRFFLAWTFRMKKQYEESKKLFEALAKTRLDDPLVIQSEMLLALIARAEGKPEEAAKRFEALAAKVGSKNGPLAALLQIHAAYTYYYDLNDAARANSALKKAKAFSVASAAISTFLTEELEPFLNRGLRDAAFHELKNGNYGEAQKLFLEALKTDPNDAWIYSGLGLTERLLSSEASGLEHAVKGRGLKEDEFTTAALAFLYETAGDMASAVPLYQKSIALNPHYQVALYNLGRLELIRGNHPPAVEFFRTVTQRKVKNRFAPYALNNASCAFWRLGQFQRSEQALREAIRLNSKLPEAHYNLSLIYEGRGDHALAQEEWNSAFQLDPALEQSLVAL